MREVIVDREAESACGPDPVPGSERCCGCLHLGSWLPIQRSPIATHRHRLEVINLTVDLSRPNSPCHPNRTHAVSPRAPRPVSPSNRTESPESTSDIANGSERPDRHPRLLKRSVINHRVDPSLARAQSRAIPTHGIPPRSSPCRHTQSPSPQSPATRSPPSPSPAKKKGAGVQRGGKTTHPVVGSCTPSAAFANPPL